MQDFVHRPSREVHSVADTPTDRPTGRPTRTDDLANLPAWRSTNKYKMWQPPNQTTSMKQAESDRILFRFDLLATPEPGDATGASNQDTQRAHVNK